MPSLLMGPLKALDTMMKYCDKDIENFAADLYMFLVPKRLRIHHIPTRIPNEQDKTIFVDDIGKTVLMMCLTKQESLCKKFTKEHRRFSKSPDAFLRYYIETGYIIFDKEEDDVFNSLILVSAMILELIAFC